jgi:large subunit ribosomal protein L10
MRKEEKKVLIDALTQQLKENNNFYITDIASLNAENTSDLRRLGFKNEIQMVMVKNTLLRKAMENVDKDYSELYSTLVGNTLIMFSEAGNAPAKMIKEFRKKTKKDKPIIKGAFIEEATYLGDDQLDFLVSIKSKDELVADIVALLQSPVKNVVSALQSGSGILTGILKTLSEKEG